MENDLEDLFNNLSKNKIEEKSKTYNDSCNGDILNDICDVCNVETIKTNNEIICPQCGTIKDGIIDFNAEWRYYGSEDSKNSDPTRCGLPTNELLPQSSLGSTISFKMGESWDMRKIRNYHQWNAMPYKERSLYNVFDGIQERAKNNGIPQCMIEEGKNLYKKISEVKIHRGSNRNGIIAACIYKACILQGSPRSAKEIAEIFKLNITHMTKGCKKFDEIINLNICNNNFVSHTSTKSIDFVHRFCSKLNIGNNIYKICEHVCLKAEEYNLVSKCIPPSIATGSIFLVCYLLNIKISKKEISTICKISEVTISKCYKKLYNHHEYLFPEHILEKLYPNQRLNFKKLIVAK